MAAAVAAVILGAAACAAAAGAAAAPPPRSASVSGPDPAPAASTGGGLGWQLLNSTNLEHGDLPELDFGLPEAMGEAEAVAACTSFCEKTAACAREQQIGGSGGSLEPPGPLFLNPLGLFLRTSIPFIHRILSAFLRA